MKRPQTVKELRDSGYKPHTVKQEMRRNLSTRRVIREAAAVGNLKQLGSVFAAPRRQPHATASAPECNAQKPDKCWIRRQSAVNLNRYGLHARENAKRASFAHEFRQFQSALSPDGTCVRA